jgi:peptidyl-prolyl cis-trans isomerase B (cyclophilin B)
MRRLSVLVVLAALVVAGCGGGQKSSTPTPRQPEKLKPPAQPLDPTKKWTLTFATDRGTFVVALAPRVSPHAAASLVALARRGFFDNTIFRRIVPGFVIQGGDPTQTGSGGPGYVTVDTPPADTTYPKGTVAMARSDLERRGAAGSQFFVMIADDPSLPPDYAVVGEVTRGLPVVEKIGTFGDPNDPTGKPTTIVVVKHVTTTAK